MSKRLFLGIYFVFGLAVLLLAAANYFGVSKNLWWFACMLSGSISSSYCFFWFRKKITEEEFLNYIVSIFMITSFLISYGLALYQGGNENLPVILCGINAGIWVIYSVWLSKKLS